MQTQISAPAETSSSRLAVDMPRVRTDVPVMRREKLTPSQIWQRKFKLRGYNVLPATLKAILNHLSLNQSTDEGHIVDLIIAEAKKKSVKSAVITKEIVDPILAAINSDGSDAAVAAIKVIDAFDVPKNVYDPLRKQWSRSTRPLSLHAEAASKAALYRERLQLLVQRMLRRVGFSKPRLDFGDDESVYDEIVPVQSLPGREGVQIVMGAISQLEDGKFFLEDLTGVIELDLSRTTENSIVMCDGYYGADSVYHALHLGNPPVETREQSMLYCGGVDFFGAGKETTEEQRQLQRAETAALDDRIVFFSDVWVDNAATMAKLRQALGGYEEQEVVPTLFVLCGNFSAKILSVYAHLRDAFRQLGELIASHPRLCEHSLFVFLPGPNDPGPANVLPRPALPPMFRKAVLEHLPRAIFSSSPCRIKYYTQEIVVFRQDLLRQMGRACVLPPSTYEAALPHQHLSIGILEQSHLCPLPLSIQPILWDFDHSLRIWPTPDLVVLADCSEQYIVKHQEAICINPGSFALDGTFTTYLPASREPENCCL